MSSIPQKNVGFPGNRINGPDEQLKTDLTYPLPRHGNPPIIHAILYKKSQEISCYYAISNAIPSILGNELNRRSKEKNIAYIQDFIRFRIHKDVLLK